MVRCVVQKSRQSSNLGGQSSKVKITRAKKRKSMALFPGALLTGASCVVRQFYAGGKINPCCLVSVYVYFVFLNVY